MTKTVQTMHDIAMLEAISKGPRIVNINGGSDKTAYHLTKKELKNLFTKHGYNVRGITWLNYISAWREIWEELAPNDAVLRTPDTEWSVIFLHPCHTDYITLVRYAEDHNIPSLVAES